MYTVYSKPNCPFCDQAKALLKSKGISFTEVVLDVGQPKIDGVTYMPVQEFKDANPNARSVPQIFHAGASIGGFTELKKHLDPGYTA